VDAYHRAPAAALHVPYIVPGENGARAARWVQFATPSGPASDPHSPDAANGGDGDGDGGVAVRISAARSFHFSAQPVTTEDLSLASHSAVLECFPRPFLSVNVDPYLMGVGGDDSWTACVHDEYLLHGGVYAYDLDFHLMRT
jgi:beta-galactosidase